MEKQSAGMSLLRSDKLTGNSEPSKFGLNQTIPLSSEGCLIYYPTCIFTCFSNRALFTIYLIAFTPARQSYRIELLFTHNNGDLGAISVTERSVALISEV